MIKIITLILMLILSCPASFADTLLDKPELLGADLALTDLFYIVHNPGTVPVDRKMQVSGLSSLYSLLAHTHAQLHDRGHSVVSLLDHTDWPAAVSMVELGYLDNMTGEIQAQLNSKADTVSVHSRGHTMASALDHTDWPAAVSVAELAYLDNMTGEIQAQLNAIVGSYLSLDQTIPENIINGAPIFNGGLDTLNSVINLRDSDVAHGMTLSNAPTDAYGQFWAEDATKGGLRITGLSDSADAMGLLLTGTVGNASPSVPALYLESRKKDGTSVQALATTETALRVNNYSSPLLTILGNGFTGLNTTAPAVRFHLANTTTVDDTKVYLDTYHATNQYCSTLRFRKSATDTIGTLTPVGVGDWLGQIEFLGVNDNAIPAWAYGAKIKALVGGLGTGDGVRTRLSLITYDKDANDTAQIHLDGNTGHVGIGHYAEDPCTALEVNGWFSTAITLTSWNPSDTETGRDSGIEFRGTQSGGEESLLGRLWFSHEGIADDEKGHFFLYLNSGADGWNPTKRLEVSSAGNFDFQAGNLLTTGTIGGGAITSSVLTSTYLPKAGVAGLLGNSSITDDGAGTVTLGSTTQGDAVTILGTLGPEKCAAGGVWAGDFHETGAWSLGAGWSIGGGVLTRAAAAVTNATYNCGEVANHTYKVIYTINSISGVAATINMKIGGVNGTVCSAAGTYTEYITAVSGADLTFTPIAATVAEIDNVHVYDVTAGGTLTTSMPILVQGYGNASAPAICVGDTGTGLFYSGGGYLTSSILGVQRFSIGTPGIYVFGPQINFGAATPDVLLTRTAAGSMTVGGTGNGQLLGIKTATVLTTLTDGASVTAASLIPDGAVVVGVTTRVQTAIGVGHGCTGYQVGDGVDPDRWGDITGTATTTNSTNADWTATTIQAFIAANNVVLTAKTGDFDGTGKVRITIHYFDSTAATS